ncbi:unnamed protein product, partial [Urochloa humidicola]
GEESEGKEKGLEGLGFQKSEQNLHDLCYLLERKLQFLCV